MVCRYTYPKNYVDKIKVEKIILVFANGETIELDKSEVEDFSFQLFDNLVYNKDGFLPVAQNGFIKLNLKDKKPKFDFGFILDQKEYRADRKTYIKKRCKSGGIVKITLMDENNWRFDILCVAKGYVDGSNFIIKVFSNDAWGSANGENLVVDLPSVTKKGVSSINIDFENCEYFNVYDKEIVDVNFVYKKELGWDGHNLYREICGGYFVVKLDKDVVRGKSYIFGRQKEIAFPTIKQLERRICEKEKEETDVCVLYVEYDRGFMSRSQEKFRLEDVRDLSQYDCDRCEYCDSDCPGDRFVSGYAQRKKDGAIKIVFEKMG